MIVGMSARRHHLLTRRLPTVAVTRATESLPSGGNHRHWASWRCHGDWYTKPVAHSCLELWSWINRWSGWA